MTLDKRWNIHWHVTAINDSTFRSAPFFRIAAVSTALFFQFEIPTHIPNEVVLLILLLLRVGFPVESPAINTQWNIH